MSQMLLHCGGRSVSFDELAAVPLPEETETYTPVAFKDIVMNTKQVADDLLKDFTYKDSMYALVTCFHLLNTDKDFGERVADEMDRMAASGELGNVEKPVKVTHLSSWTKTEGNA